MTPSSSGVLPMAPLVLRGHKEEKVVDTSSFSKQSKISVIAFLVAMVAVVLLGVVKSLRPVFG